MSIPSTGRGRRQQQRSRHPHRRSTDQIPSGVARPWSEDDVRLTRGSYRQFLNVARPKEPIPPDHVLAWVAGYCDGEAAFMYKSVPVVQVSNCHLPTLVWLCEQFSGSVRMLRAGTVPDYHNPGKRRIAELRPCYQWCVASARARWLLQLLLPFLREKRRQAELVLSIEPGQRGRRLTPEQRQHRLEVQAELRRLKRSRFQPSPPVTS